jgi:glyoxylase-like metal-dependent hydrolase (beta-lactamase superfamily II)
MQIYPGADLIECEIGGRPLYLPLLREGREALLLDCGTRHHAAKDVPARLNHLGLGEEDLTWLIITHPDGDHCGGTAEIKRRYPKVRLACGDADIDLIESPEHLFAFRYDAYRQNHGIFYDSQTTEEIKNCASGPQEVTFTFVGGEIMRLGRNRLLEIWHLPGHSHGHLGIYDRSHRVLYYGDAIQGAGYRSVRGSWSLCPTYLYVNAYLQTIRTIENSAAETIVGCHWPVLRGKEAIRQFCAESRNFVAQADRLITDCVRNHASGVTLRELCEQLSDQLGEWPSAVSLELANAFAGHLDRGVESGRFEVDRSAYPFRYRHRGAAQVLVAVSAEKSSRRN